MQLRVDYHEVTATGKDAYNRSCNMLVESDTAEPSALAAMLTTTLRARRWIEPRSRIVVTRVAVERDAATIARQSAATIAAKVRMHRAYHTVKGADAPCPHHDTFPAETT